VLHRYAFVVGSLGRSSGLVNATQLRYDTSIYRN
jgi:hypothetical protein